MQVRPPFPFACPSAAQSSALATAKFFVMPVCRCFAAHYGTSHVGIAAQVLAGIEPVFTFSIPGATFFVLFIVIAVAVPVISAAPRLRGGRAE
jgi:hypothetical protein